MGSRTVKRRFEKAFRGLHLFTKVNLFGKSRVWVVQFLVLNRDEVGLKTGVSSTYKVQVSTEKMKGTGIIL